MTTGVSWQDTRTSFRIRLHAVSHLDGLGACIFALELLLAIIALLRQSVLQFRALSDLWYEEAASQ